MSEDDERAPLTYAQALAMLPDGDRIHTFRSAGMLMIGADWQRQEIISAIETFGAELAGAGATSMGHRLAVIDDKGPLFIATKEPER